MQQTLPSQYDVDATGLLPLFRLAFFFFAVVVVVSNRLFFLYVLEVFLVVHLLIHNRFTFLCIFASHVRTICFSECQVNAISFSLFFFISCLLFVEPKSAERRKGHAHFFFFFQVGALFHRSSGLFFFPRSSSFPLLSIFTPDFLFVPLSSGGAQRLLLHWLAVFFFFSDIAERAFCLVAYDTLKGAQHTFVSVCIFRFKKKKVKTTNTAE